MQISSYYLPKYRKIYRIYSNQFKVMTDFNKLPTLPVINNLDFYVAFFNLLYIKKYSKNHINHMLYYT